MTKVSRRRLEPTLLPLAPHLDSVPQAGWTKLVLRDLYDQTLKPVGESEPSSTVRARVEVAPDDFRLMV